MSMITIVFFCQQSGCTVVHSAFTYLCRVAQKTFIVYSDFSSAALSLLLEIKVKNVAAHINLISHCVLQTSHCYYLFWKVLEKYFRVKISTFKLPKPSYLSVVIP